MASPALPPPPPPRSRSRLARFALALGRIVAFTVAAVAGLAAGVALTGLILWKSGRWERLTLGFFLNLQTRAAPPEEPWPPGRWKPGSPLPPDPWTGPKPSAALARTTDDLYQTTNIWNVHLQFTEADWKQLRPRRVPAVTGFFNPEGRMVLRNEAARRSGVAGSFGFDFDWSRADIDFGGLAFTNAAVRYKGNGTYITALYRWKRPFKVDLDRHVAGRTLAGVRTLNFGNLVADASCISDALGYECCRQAGLPAPRTAFARLFLTIDGQPPSRPLGLYVMPENIDGDFAKAHWGTRKVAIFKPVTYDLFLDLGPDWKAYERIYDPKGKITDADRQRVLDLSQLVTHASDADFAARIGDFVDLDNYARFVACLALMSSYDGYLCNGQNYFLFLHPETRRFGFIPWDLDQSWGEFGFVGKVEQQEQASLLFPCVVPNRFHDRLMAVESFKQQYLGIVREISRTAFEATRLLQRIDELGNVLRSAVAVESPHRLVRFETAISSADAPGPREGNPFSADRPAHQLKRFIRNRARSVADQLAGLNTGIRLEPQNQARNRNRNPAPEGP